MARDITLLELDITEGSRHSVTINEYPDSCGRCGKPTHPVFRQAQSLGAAWDYDEIVEVVFKCSRNECKRYFIAYYTKVGRHGDYFTLSRFDVPEYFKPVEFPEEINNVSPKFKRIYNQALIAESMGLDEVCGGGYRKAVEFLVKDYLSTKFPERAEEIKGYKTLSPVLELISDVNIKKCTERAAWLGNDEVHYYRIWTDKDITNLKELIDLLTHWIKAELLTQKYDSEMH